MSAYTPTLVTAVIAGLTTSVTTYSINDQAGTETTVPSIGDASGKVLITNIDMVDYDARIAAHELRLFKAATTPAADNAAAAWSDADALNRIGPPILCSSIKQDTNQYWCGYSFPPFEAVCDASGHLYLDVVLLAVPGSNFFATATALHFTVAGFKVS
jgi:hypothetical protein